MPLYFYRCRHCGHKFEMLRRINDSDSQVECPECRKKEPEKIVTPFYGHNFSSAGTGFRFG